MHMLINIRTEGKAILFIINNLQHIVGMPTFIINAYILYSARIHGGIV